MFQTHRKVGTHRRRGRERWFQRPGNRRDLSKFRQRHQCAARRADEPEQRTGVTPLVRGRGALLVPLGVEGLPFFLGYRWEVLDVRAREDSELINTDIGIFTKIATGLGRCFEPHPSAGNQRYQSSAKAYRLVELACYGHQPVPSSWMEHWGVGAEDGKAQRRRSPQGRGSVALPPVR